MSVLNEMVAGLSERFPDHSSNQTLCLWRNEHSYTYCEEGGENKQKRTEEMVIC